MTHIEALAALAGHPHLWRFRELCEDDADPVRRDAYRALVVRLASGEPDPPLQSATKAEADPAYLARLPPMGGCCR